MDSSLLKDIAFLVTDKQYIVNVANNMTRIVVAEFQAGFQLDLRIAWGTAKSTKPTVRIARFCARNPFFPADLRALLISCR